MINGHLQKPPLSRRRLLGLGAMSTVGLGLTLTGCGSDDTTATPSTTGSGGAPDLGRLTYAFSWLNDVTQAGPYISDTEGYYLDEGFSSVDFVPGGPSSVPVLSQLLNGSAQFGVSGAPEIAAANNGGASFRVIGAMYQKSPLCILSLAATPLSQPDDLKGRTVGVADSDKPSLLAYLSIIGLDPDELTLVPFQYDPAPLINGQMDGYVGYTTQDPITLQEAGHDSIVQAFSDFGYDTVTQLYVATTEAIETSRDLLKAALTADIRGWRDNIADPEQGAKLAVEKYGKSLGYTVANQVAANEAGVVLMRTADTEEAGILTVTAELQAKTVSTLALSGTDIDVDTLFDLSLLDEVYSANPDLKALA